MYYINSSHVYLEEDHYFYVLFSFIWESRAKNDGYKIKNQVIHTIKLIRPNIGSLLNNIKLLPTFNVDDVPREIMWLRIMQKKSSHERSEGILFLHNSKRQKFTLC